MQQDKTKKIDWNEFLNTENKTELMIAEAIQAVGEWTTCAVGNQCDIIPRKINGEPIDCTLQNLGMDFFLEVRKKQWGYAIIILRKIEERSAVLIAKIKSTPRKSKNIMF